MQSANEQMRQALSEAIHELFLSEDGDHSSRFIEVLNDIRSDLNLIMIDSTYVKNYIWEKFRVPATMLQTLMATTATFLTNVDDIDDIIVELVPRVIPYTEKNLIVDDETISKTVEHQTLIELLRNNYWLLFVIYAVLNMRVVLEVTADYVKGNGNGS